MKKLLILVIFATIGFSFIVIQSSDAETIGYYHYHHIIRPEHTSVAEPTTAVLYYGPYSESGEIIGGEYNPPWGPVYSIELTSGDVGKNYTTNSGDAFEVAVESMTNGTLDSASWMGFNRGHGGPESFLWLPTESNFDDDGYGYEVFGYYAGHNGFDFEGFIIDSISFNLQNFEPRNVEFTIALSGSPVPEPATILLLGTGLVGLAGIGRKRFKK